MLTKQIGDSAEICEGSLPIRNHNMLF